MSFPYFEERASGKISGNHIQWAPVVISVSSALQAVIDGRNWGIPIQKQTGFYNGGAGLVYTTVVIPLVSGRRYLITQWRLYLSTNNDTAEVRLAKTENPDGSGTATLFGPTIPLITSTLPQDKKPLEITEVPPSVVDYEEGVAEAMAIYVLANDDSAEVSVFVKGWWESILPNVDTDS